MSSGAEILSSSLKRTVQQATQGRHSPASQRGRAIRPKESVGNDSIFVNWDKKFAALWGHQPVCAPHRLHELDLFLPKSLEELIERYPREHYSIIRMGQQGADARVWEEGDLGDLSGAEVLDKITNGRFWLNLRHTDLVDGRFADLVRRMFGELNQLIPGLNAKGLGCGILISSPKAQVYYHADLPGHALFQIAGSKRVYLYPAARPFIGPENLEHIAIHGLEVDVPYERWYDEHAQIFNFGPGQMLAWPHTAPHRVDNADVLNVSLTVEFATEEIRRAQIVNLANGFLRYRLGWPQHSQTINGPSFWIKAALQKGLRKTRWLGKQSAPARTIKFKLDRSQDVLEL